MMGSIVKLSVVLFCRAIYKTAVAVTFLTILSAFFILFI